MAFYKFDPLGPLEILYIGQPILFNEYLEKCHAGPGHAILLVYQSEIYAAKVFFYLGKGISHPITSGAAWVAHISSFLEVHGVNCPFFIGGEVFSQNSSKNNG